MPRPLFLALLLLGLSGCAGSRAVASGDPRSLTEINGLLEGREARIELTDGTALTGREVTVAFDSTRFLSEAGPRTLATAEVHRVFAERARATLHGATLGGVVAGFGLVILGSHLDPSVALITPFIVGGGAVLGLVLGAGEQAGPRERVVYEGPVERYGSGGVGRE